MPVFGVLGSDWFPRAIQVALTPNCVEFLGRGGGVVASQDLIAAKEAVMKATEGLAMQCGSRGTPLYQSEELREIVRNVPSRLALQNLGVYLSSGVWDTVQGKKYTTQGGTSQVYCGPSEVFPPVLVLPLS